MSEIPSGSALGLLAATRYLPRMPRSMRTSTGWKCVETSDGICASPVEVRNKGERASYWQMEISQCLYSLTQIEVGPMATPPPYLR